jgi:hypothetical protein
MKKMVLETLLHNKVFWSIVLAGAIAQGLKMALIYAKHGLHPADVVVTGGMPSAHTALVCALVLIEYLTSGFSNLFFVTVVLAVIVIRDALGVRRTAGEEGQIIAKLVKKAKLHITDFHYSLGHTPSQVIVGAIIGFLSAGIAYYFV